MPAVESCPFCGSIRINITLQHGPIRCDDCGARGPTKDDTLPGVGSALAMWNERAPAEVSKP